MGDGTLTTLPETEDAGQEYIDSLTFLCDSSLAGLKDYGVLSGGTETSQVWSTPSGVLAVGDIDQSKIVYPNDGSIVSAAALTILPEKLRFLQNYRMLAYAILLIVVMLLSNNPLTKALLRKVFSFGRKEKSGEEMKA